VRTPAFVHVAAGHQKGSADKQKRIDLSSGGSVRGGKRGNNYRLPAAWGGLRKLGRGKEVTSNRLLTAAVQSGDERTSGAIGGRRT